jgi:nucleoside-diphosphate-sugar epimerase
MIPGVRVLVVGGCGYVAGLVLPAVRRVHAVRTFDRAAGGGDHVVGSALDPAALRGALDGVDAVVHCAMGTGGDADAFAVNVTSVHLTLAAAHAAGVRHAVHISSLSVFADITRRPLDESTPPDATDVYGLTKRLGEQVGAAAVARWGMSLNVLRLAWPTSDDVWPAWPPVARRLRYAPNGALIQATAGGDLARALLAALDHRDGYQVFTISGDTSARLWSTAKAERVLGWRPTMR